MSDQEVVELVEVQKIPKKSKKSKVKLSLNSFLANDDFGKASNWADDVPDLPTAPAQRTDDAPAYGQRGGSGGYRGADEREPRRSNRPELPVPDKPPFMAFVGNLNFETNETDLELLFRDMSINNIKIVRDQDDKPRGFGYVEFADKCDLVAALGYNNESVRGRRININVAEQKQREGRGYGSDSRNDTFSRADMAPLPPREGGDRRGPPPSRYGNDFSRDDMGSQLPPRDNDRRGPPQSRYNDFSRDDMAGPLPPRENDRRGPPPSRYNNDFSRDDMAGPLPPRENDRRGPPQNRYNDFSRDDMAGPLPPREQRKPVESRYKDFSRDEMTGPLPPKERSERRSPRDNSREPERRGPAPSKYGGEFSRDDITGPLPPKDKKQERKKLQLEPRTKSTTSDQQQDSKKSDAKPVHILKKDDENKGKKTVVQPEVKEGVKTGNAYDLLGEEM